jgi:hypothetical protein
MNELNNQGYLFLKNFIDDELFNEMNDNILDNDKVNYYNYDKIVQKILCKLNYKLDWNSIALKYRVSEGKNKKTSNSIDAAGFHRDIYIIGNNMPNNIYTLVIYLDKSILEIIPNSHKVFNYNNIENIKEIYFNPSDAILFNSSILHRGKFEKQNKNKTRKCIQIFDIFKNIRDYNNIHKYLLTLGGHDNETSFSSNIIQSYFKIPYLNNFINKQTIYMNIDRKNDIYYNNKYKYISTEGSRKRTIKDIDNGNMYRIINNINDSCNTSRDHYHFIEKNIINVIIKYIIIFIIICIILLYLLYKYLFFKC